MDLQKNYRFSENQEITKGQLTDLANDLLDVNWIIRFQGKTHEVQLNKLGWTFEFNNRKSAIGRCSSRIKTIFASASFFATNKNNSREWEDTLRHEVAHAIDFVLRRTSDHGHYWKIIATQTGATPSATTSFFQKVDSPYVWKCPNCGKESAAHRKSTATYACNDCCTKYNKGKYTIKFKLEFMKKNAQVELPTEELAVPVVPAQETLKEKRARIAAEKAASVPTPESAIEVVAEVVEVAPEVVETEIPATTEIPEVVAPATGTKKCKDCGAELPIDDFYKLKNSPDGHHPRCKKCYNERKKK